ncbi:MAG: septum formation initiator family protein [Gammaproteobacteria bacterium]|nr:septum formation initiator family protein [Gammaproteobacteria bacterium]
MRKATSAILMLVLVVLQYQIWFGKSSVRAINALETELENQRVNNTSLEERNHQMEIEVLDLKNGLEAVEERARAELGLIGQDETFYLIVD